MVTAPCKTRGCINYAYKEGLCHEHYKTKHRERNKEESRMAYTDPAYRSTAKRLRATSNCWRCLKPPTETDPIEIHHRISLLEGGTNTPDNLVPLHKSCHRIITTENQRNRTKEVRNG